jgi:hypothetical protein
MVHPLLCRARTVLVALVAYAPAFVTLRLIWRYGVDVPCADEWGLAPFLLKAHQHSLTFFDFFMQHNEHRYLFPKLLLLVVAPLTSGNVKGQMFFSFILALLASGGVWCLLCRTLEISIDKKLWLLGLINLLLFGLVQAENWTWGYQFVLFLVNGLLVAGIAAAVSRLSLSAKFVASLVIAILATFSFGGGAVIWVIIFPLALLHETRESVRQRCWWLAGWLSTWAAAMTGYFFHYVRPPYHPHLAASHNPLDYLVYIWTFLGAPLSNTAPTGSVVLASIVGAILMLFYLTGVGWTLQSRDAAFRRNMLPWLGLGAYALISAVLAAVTRIGFGTNQALESRYTTFSLYISISIIGMFAVLATKLRSTQQVSSRASSGLKSVKIAGLTLLLAGHLHASAGGMHLFKAAYANRLHGKAALLFTNVLDSGPLHQSYLITNAAQTREFANIENRLGFIHPALFPSPELSKLDSRPQLAGFLEDMSVEGQTCRAFGWAMIPKGHRPADAVLLAYDDPIRGPIAFAITVPIMPRPEVQQALHDNQVEPSGWGSEFERSKVPPGDQQISAWAFDAEKNLLYPLLTPQTIH